MEQGTNKNIRSWREQIDNWPILLYLLDYHENRR